MKIFNAVVLAVGTMLAANAAIAGTPPPVVPHQSVTMCGDQAVDADIAYRYVDASNAEIKVTAFTRGLGINPPKPQSVTLNVATAEANSIMAGWLVSDSAKTSFASYPGTVASIRVAPRSAACSLRTKIVAQMRCPTGTLDTKVIEHTWTSCSY